MTQTTHGCATREEYEEYVRSVEAFIKPRDGIKADIENKFEERLIELLGPETLAGDKMSFFEVAKRFYWAGYNDGEHRGYTMGVRRGQ
jgi:hypothetical protein